MQVARIEDFIEENLDLTVLGPITEDDEEGTAVGDLLDHVEEVAHEVFTAGRAHDISITANIDMQRRHGYR